MIRQRLNASEDSLNIKKEAEYCIAQTARFMQTKKQQKFMNKLSLEYFLGQCSKEKFYPKLIGFSAKETPETFVEGQRFAHTQYSSVRVRKHKKAFLSQHRYSENPEHKQSIKKYSNILSQRKKRQQQGGVETFWTFKRKAAEEDTKKKTHKQGGGDKSDDSPQEGNRAQKAFKRILAWGKQNPDITSSVISKNLLKNYIASKLGENFGSWFVSIDFYQIRAYLAFKEFEQLWERFRTIKSRESHVVSFFIFDDDADGFLSPRDVFGVFQKQLNPKIEKDVLKIAQFVKKNKNKVDNSKQEFKIEQVIIRDDWLTIKDYEIYFKKVDEPFIKATNKKDTVFSKTFAVLDHREKVRSVRKLISQKKNMYDELYGQLTKEKRNHEFIEQEDYRLNYAFFYEIFGQSQTETFKFFCDFVFNL